MTINVDLVSRYVRRYAEGNMTATVSISRMLPPAFNEATGDLSSVRNAIIYAGKGRVYTVAGPLTMSLGEEPQYFSQTFVSVPLTAAPRVDDVVTIIDHQDPALLNRKFRVLDVESGGQYPCVRRMQVSGVQRSQQWEGHPAAESVAWDIPEEWRI